MNSQNDIRYCLYPRKSSESDEEQMLSVESQTETMRRQGEREDLNIVAVRPESHSAKKSGTRPVFNQIISDIRSGKFNALLVWLPDRLSRNAGDAAVLVDLMDAGLLKEVRAHNQTFRGDRPSDKFMLMLLCSHAKLENDNKGESVKRGMNTKREMGVPSGVAPPGYRNGGREKGGKWFEPDDGEPNRFCLVQNAFRLILNGTPPPDALRILNDEWGFRTIKRRKLGGGPIAESTWYVMLGTPLYFGKFICFKNTPEEKWYEIKDPHYRPMITEEEFWKIQDILGEKRGRQRPKLQGKERGVFLQLLTCGSCGKMMSHDIKRQIRCVCKHKYSARHRDTCPKCGLHESKVPAKRKHSYDYWFCTKKGNGCSQSVIRTEDIEKQIAATLDSVTIPQEFIDWALEYLDKQNDEEAMSQQAKRQSLQKAYDENENELIHLHKLYLKGGFDYEGGDEEYHRFKQERIANRGKWKSKLEGLDTHGDDWREQTERGYLFCKEAAAAFMSGDYRTKREILTTLCEKAVVHGQKIVLTIEPPFKFIQKKMDNIKTKFVSTEPEIISGMALGVANKSFADAVKTAWLPRQDSNL